jgi:hypothetical protein
MASSHSKRSIPLAQPRARASHKTSTAGKAESDTSTRRRGRPTSRNACRELYRFEEIRNKTVECVEFYTCGEYHCLDVRFQDKTSLVFEIEPTFTLRADHSDWKTGNWRGIKTWPRIRSRALNP